MGATCIPIRLQPKASLQMLDFNCWTPYGSKSVTLKLIGIRMKDQQIEKERYSRRHLAVTVSSEEKSLPLTKESWNNKASEDNSNKFYGQPIDKSELETMRTDPARMNLIRKLSEANQYNRHLKRQLNEKELALRKCKSELAIMEMELQALVQLAEEVAKLGHKSGARKINGKYIDSHLEIRLEELHKKLVQQINDVDAMQFREVPLLWYGMAEDIKVMGSFDGWTHGEQMAPEMTGTFTKFSTSLKLRPGRYEIKFLVDGEWQLSPHLPTIGEGLMVNNLLVVE